MKELDCAELTVGEPLAAIDLAARVTPAVDTEVERVVPGELGVWVFILGDMLVFSLLFGSYAWYRHQDHALFVASQATLSIAFGVVNTLLLLTASLLVVLALHRARRSSIDSVPPLLAQAVGCGVGFCVSKFFEYREKISAGYTLLSNDFFMYYYMLTGIHLLHVAVGLGVLIFLYCRARQGRYAASDMRNLESGGLIWHMVDLLWIVLFPLLYLIK